MAPILPVLVNQDKPLQTFVFSSVVPDKAVNIAFVETQDVTPKCVLNINEDLNTFPENKDFYSSDITYLDDDTKTYLVKSSAFLITNKFNAYNTPLFHRHKLLHTVWVNTVNVSTIIIEDSNGKIVDPKTYIYHAQTQSVYHNLNNLEKLYYIVYIEADDSNNIVNQSARELLNPDAAFTPMDVTSLTCLNRLSLTSNSYSLTTNNDFDTNNAFPYVIQLPTQGKWALKYVGNKGIRLHYPNEMDVNKPWYLSVSYDNIKRYYESSIDGQTLPHIYTIAEFYNQAFNPCYPYKLNKLERASFVDSTIIKVANPNLLVQTNYPLDVVVLDAYGNYKYAFSTNLSQTSTIANNLDWLPLDFGDIDKVNGYINLNVKISYTDVCLVTYFSKSDTYAFTAKNFNPRFDNELFTQETIIYCKPIVNDPYSSVTHTNSIFFIVFHMDGSIYDMYDDFANVSNDPDLHESGDLHANLLIETKAEFLNNYIYPNGLRWLLLGSVTALHPNSINESVVLDARVRGGGLKLHVTENTSLIKTHPEIEWYWDMGNYDGAPFPGAGAIVVSIPNTLLYTYTEEEIRDKILKHTALGVYPIINYYYKCGEGYGASPYGTCPYGE